jgi:hypothetical protein
MTRIKHLVGEHPDLAAFLGLALLVLLGHVALESTKNLTATLLAGIALAIVISLAARRKIDA